MNHLSNRVNNVPLKFLSCGLVWIGVFTFCCILFASGQNRENYTIVGRVIDDEGNAVTTADVIVAPVHYVPTSFERFTVSEGTDANGRFVIKTRFSRNASNERILSDKNQMVFVWIDDDLESLSTMRPPFESIRKHDRRFNGRPISLGSKSTIDVGDVKVQFWYGRADLIFNAKEGANRLRIDLRHVWLRIRNQNGRSVHFTTLSADDIKRYVKNDGRKLSISLPEGRWKVELLEFDSRRTITQSPYFSVRRRAAQSINMKGRLY